MARVLKGKVIARDKHVCKSRQKLGVPQVPSLLEHICVLWFICVDKLFLVCFMIVAVMLLDFFALSFSLCQLLFCVFNYSLGVKYGHDVLKLQMTHDPGNGDAAAKELRLKCPLDNVWPRDVERVLYDASHFILVELVYQVDV